MSLPSAISTVSWPVTFVHGIAAMVRRRGLDLHQALEKAAVLERGIIEQGFFRVFAGDDPAIREEFDALARHTEAHLEKILKQLG